MPDDDKAEEQETEETVEGETAEQSAEPVKAAEPAKPDPREAENAALRAALTKADAREERFFNALAANKNAGNVPADDTPRITVSENDIEAAYDAGDDKKGRQLERKLQREENAVAQFKLKREAIDPLNVQVGGYGMPAISALVKEVVARDPKLKHFERLKGGIEKHVGNLTPEAQMNPEVIKAAYYHEVGANFDTLVDEEIERRSRKAVANPGSPSSSRAGRGQGNNAIPTVEQLYGADVAREVEKKGGADAWAKKMGYSGGWNTYVKETMGGNA